MKRAMVYYALMMFLGMICGYIYFFNKAVSIISAVSICIAASVIMHTRYTIPAVIFMAAGMFLFVQYYSMNVPEKGIYEVTIERQSGGYTTARYKGRSVGLKGKDISKIYEGTVIKAEGRFEKDVSYQYGEIGCIYVKSVDIEHEGITAYINRLKKQTTDSVIERLGERNGGIVSSACYGNTDYLDYQYKDELRNLGIIHIISISGFHISLIFTMINCILGWKAGLFLCFLYTVFTGGRVATVRAFLMIFIMKLSKVLYRKYDPLSALALSAVIILTSRPYAALDMGFHLSYLATAGIILFNNDIRKILYKLPSKINESISLCLSAQIFVFPYLVFSSNSVAISFIIGNLILVPMYSAVVIIGVLYVPLQFFCVIGNIILSLMESSAGFIAFITEAIESYVPGYIYVDYTFGVVYCAYFLGMYMHFHNVRYGKKIASAAIITAIAVSYNIWPEIAFVRERKEEGITIKDGFHRNIVILRGTERAKLKNRYKGFFVIQTDYDKACVNFRNKYGIIFNKGKNYIVTDRDYRLIEFAEDDIYIIINGEILKIGR